MMHSTWKQLSQVCTAITKWNFLQVFTKMKINAGGSVLPPSILHVAAWAETMSIKVGILYWPKVYELGTPLDIKQHTLFSLC